MLKYSKVVDNKTKLCEVGTGTNTEFYKSIGMTEQDVEFAYDGNYYLVGHAPVKPEPTVDEQNEAIRQTREQLYIEISDPLKQDYDEATARGDVTAEEKKILWLESKDAIRAENPYVEKPEVKGETNAVE